MRRAVLALALVSFAGCSPPADRDGAREIVTDAGYAGVRIGMTLDEVQAAVGHPLDFDEPLDDPNACRSFSLAPGEEQASFMAEANRVTRVSFLDARPPARTPEGVGVGSTAAAVRAAYPNAIEQPAPYDEPPAHDLVVWIAPEQSGYRFEIGQDGRVHTLHAGGPSILYVEGCL